ncbi:MAG: hypothetical protein A2X61_12460 [Ignavibacteria bacterium GWB2_35_12]|nr:MAG: hypothetical protein A2X63_07500 [Ignavibacteria bacterium GWA2_35_8]OGU41602.1 MAG: hypothetical protein A2X61_12460 [Ignavibacteria bacterium GWB2_35_12]OGU97220.1 MAG: hypothetical protein A2220_06100 [Ignavibacteria bacterium RIFOXYA2_FULL_35_10]OGV24935.1 MAG: hypothetical protein A2475_16305 [Ignavibacteria bacterium RIFOXYC2_FULL_35_21]
MKKFESLIWKLFGLLTVLGITSMFISCTGPEGPAGPSAEIVCAVCHGADADDVNLKFNQYHLSRHNTGVIYEEEAGRLACGGCHTGDGFAEAATLGQNDPVSKASSKINCKACHTIHKNFDTTDFARRITAGFALRHTGAMIDQKDGNLCSKCHQARPFTRTVPDTISRVSGTTYSRFGPHYGVVANVVTMNGPYQITGDDTYPTINQHASLPKGCVSCHMGSDPSNPAAGGHTFLMTPPNLAKIVECRNCHDSTTISKAAIQNDIGPKLVIYRQALIDKGWLDTTAAVSAEGYNVLGEYFRADQAKVAFPNPTDVEVVLNYLYVAKDRSKGVHNPAYIKALVNNGLQYLGK